MKNHDFPVELAVTRGLSHNPFSKVNLLNFRVFPSIGANIEIMTKGNKEIRVPPAACCHWNPGWPWEFQAASETNGT